MCALIGTMEEQPVPFCIEHMGRQESTRYFHSAFIKDQVTVRFQLVNQVRRNFRLKDPQMAEKVSSVYIIMFYLYNKFNVNCISGKNIIVLLNRSNLKKKEGVCTSWSNILL